MHHTDWAAGTTRKIADRFPTLPTHFAGGISVAHVRPDWAYVFIKGGEVHRTDLGKKVVRKIADELPEPWKSEA
ncbi:MAG: hypothetical protein JF621_12640 [Streptomyces turgidiscabies]|nr:hypothetical protein [Streptomyces turgidiscabies]